MHPEYQKYGSPTIRLIEEMSEVTKLLCKGERFGWDDHKPGLPETETNRKRIKEEISDVWCALEKFDEWLDEQPTERKTQIV